VGGIDFKVIFAAENSNKFQKTRFWNEKLVEAVVTLGPTAISMGSLKFSQTYKTLSHV
jgi:hypothetical protein